MRWIKRIIFFLVIAWILRWIFFKIPPVLHKGILVDAGALAGLVVFFLVLEKLKRVVNRWQERLKAAGEKKTEEKGEKKKKEKKVRKYKTIRTEKGGN